MNHGVATYDGRNAPMAFMYNDTPRSSTSFFFWMLFVFVLTLLLPVQEFVKLNNVPLFPYRMILIISIPGIVLAFARGSPRASFPDALVLGAMLWMLVALAVVEGFDRALRSSSALMLDIAGAYFLARTAIRNLDDFRFLLKLIALPFLVASVFVAVEAFSGHYIVGPFFAELFPGAPPEGLPIDIRYGFLRAAGPFPHPILAGLTLASLFSLYTFGNSRGISGVLGVLAALSSLFTLSSAAILSLLVQVAANGWNLLVKWTGTFSWRAAMALLLVIVLLLEIGTKSGPLGLVIRFGALDPASSAYRTLIWQFGTTSVASHPWFGIGFQEWDRPFWMGQSIDNYWLQLAMQHGLPMAAMALLVPVFAIIRLALRSGAYLRRDRDQMRGLAVSVASTTLLGFSVSYWASVLAWFFLLIGCGISLSEEKAPAYQANRVGG